MAKAKKQITTTQRQVAIVERSIDDATWGTSLGGSGTFSVEGIRAISRSLSPSDAYQLSCDVRSAISAIATNIAKAKLRLFARRSGDEIVGGDLYDLLRRPAPYWSTSSFIQEIISHYLLSGELAVSILGADSGRVAGLLPLNPFRLRINSPPIPDQRSDIKLWEYHWPSGMTSLYPAESLIFEKNFNPSSDVRGTPPLLAGVNEIDAGYQAIKYNRQFFSNNAVPNHILVLPEGISAEDKKAFKEQYVGMHSTYNGGAHKVMVVEGGQGLDIKPLEQTVKDGLFLDLQKLTTAKIMQLYRVPPVIGGQWDSTKFDSVDVQREVFAEETLLPLMEMLSQALQTQLVDRYFRLSSFERGAGVPRMGKYLTRAFGDARDNRVESDVVVLLDPDTLPIVGKLKQARVDYAIKLQQAFRITPRAAAEEVGFDFAHEDEDNPAMDLVWHSTTETPYDPEAAQEEPPQPTAEQPPAEAEPLDEATAEKAIQYRNYYRDLRKLSLESLDSGRVFSLAAADALQRDTVGEDVTLHRQVRVERHRLAALLKGLESAEEKKELAKKHFNRPRAYFRDLARGENNE